MKRIILIIYCLVMLLGTVSIAGATLYEATITYTGVVDGYSSVGLGYYFKIGIDSSNITLTETPTPNPWMQRDWTGSVGYKLFSNTNTLIAGGTANYHYGNPITCQSQIYGTDIHIFAEEALEYSNWHIGDVWQGQDYVFGGFDHYEILQVTDFTILNPVPEPSTLLLLGLGLAAAAFVRRKFMKKQLDF